jgi:hypothetical protein
MRTFEIVLRRPAEVTADDVEFLSTADVRPEVGSTIVAREEEHWVVTLIEPPLDAANEARLICLPASDVAVPEPGGG